jgi:hypothetical protein
MPKVTFKGDAAAAGEKVKSIIASDHKITIRIPIQYYDPEDQAYRNVKGSVVTIETSSVQLVMGLADKIRGWIADSNKQSEE